MWHGQALHYLFCPYPLINVFAAQMAEPQGRLPQAEALVVRVFGDGGPVVADRGGESGDQHQAARQQRLDPGPVGFESLDAEAPEPLTAAAQQLNALQQIVGDQGLIHIQLLGIQTHLQAKTFYFPPARTLNTTLACPPLVPTSSPARSEPSARRCHWGR